MQAQRLSVSELKDYWRDVNNLRHPPPGSMVDAVPLFLMHSWNDICSQLNWSLHLLEAGYFGRKEYGYCGVYRLIGLASDGDLRKPATLNRVCGQDESGTLYVGESGILNSRLNQLRRSALSAYEQSHGAIGMLKKIPVLKFSPTKLAIALLLTDVECTEHVEEDLIKAYVNTFGVQLKKGNYPAKVRSTKGSPPSISSGKFTKLTRLPAPNARAKCASSVSLTRST